MGVVHDGQFQEVPVHPLAKNNGSVAGHVIPQQTGRNGRAVLGAVIDRDLLIRRPHAVHHHERVAILAALADIDIHRLETDCGIIADQFQQGSRLRPWRGSLEVGQFQVD